MPREQHDYDDIPGTFVFDAERSRQGYGINMFCMSLMKDQNRKAFEANEPEYTSKKFKLTPEQTQGGPQARLQPPALEARQQRIYFTAKLGATDGHSIPPSCAATMRPASTPGRLRRDDDRRRPLGRRQSQPVRQKRGRQRTRRAGQAEGRKKAKAKKAGEGQGEARQGEGRRVPKPPSQD